VQKCEQQFFIEALARRWEQKSRADW